MKQFIECNTFSTKAKTIEKIIMQLLNNLWSTNIFNKRQLLQSKPVEFFSIFSYCNSNLIIIAPRILLLSKFLNFLVYLTWINLVKKLISAKQVVLLSITVHDELMQSKAKFFFKLNYCLKNPIDMNKSCAYELQCKHLE